MQVGPFVYQALTIKDTVEEDGKSNLHYNEDGSTLTYRPRSLILIEKPLGNVGQVLIVFAFRRFYFLDREQSKGDPDTTYLTV